mmetsp:Transcript_59096/g.137599  ORF Transcript_59096/g.137599 Transcript_59096/m.137599 type:complete len:208 (-) Transcript_59096:87-710(-)
MAEQDGVLVDEDIVRPLHNAVNEQPATRALHGERPRSRLADGDEQEENLTPREQGLKDLQQLFAVGHFGVRVQDADEEEPRGCVAEEALDPPFVLGCSICRAHVLVPDAVVSPVVRSAACRFAAREGLHPEELQEVRESCPQKVDDAFDGRAVPVEGVGRIAQLQVAEARRHSTTATQRDAGDGHLRTPVHLPIVVRRRNHRLWRQG